MQPRIPRDCNELDATGLIVSSVLQRLTQLEMERRNDAGSSRSGDFIERVSRRDDACGSGYASTRRSENPRLVKVPDNADRIASRHAFERWISIHREQGSIKGWTRDISESGLSAFIAQVLMPGEAVVLEITLQDMDPLKVPARVVRTLGTEYGFQFTALSSGQRDQIRAALDGSKSIAGQQYKKGSRSML